MKKRSSSKTSKTNHRRLHAMTDRDFKITSEHPELDINHIARVIVRRGLKPVPPKASVSLRIDADVMEWKPPFNELHKQAAHGKQIYASPSLSADADKLLPFPDFTSTPLRASTTPC